jgi:hypothetical protein
MSINNCNQNGQMSTEVYGDDWILPNSDTNCDLGVVITNGTLPCGTADFTTARTQCKPILDALNHTGIFANCSLLDADTIKQLYSDCAYDYCQLPNRNQLCEVQ